MSLFTLISLEMLLGTEFSVGKKSFPQSTAGYVMPHLLFTLTINVKEDVIHKDPVKIVYLCIVLISSYLFKIFRYDQI